MIHYLQQRQLLVQLVLAFILVQFSQQPPLWLVLALVLIPQPPVLVLPTSLKQLAPHSQSAPVLALIPQPFQVQQMIQLLTHYQHPMCLHLCRVLQAFLLQLVSHHPPSLVLQQLFLVVLFFLELVLDLNFPPWFLSYSNFPQILQFLLIVRLDSFYLLSFFLPLFLFLLLIIYKNPSNSISQRNLW